MPELPEVETISSFFKNKIINLVIKDILWIEGNNLFKNKKEFDIFKDQILNEKIINVQRRGKYLLIFFVSFVILIHFRMEGSLTLRSFDTQKEKYGLIEFYLSNNQILTLTDFRKFSTLDLINLNELELFFTTKKIGLEPFDSRLTIKYLKTNWNKRKIRVKQALMEQRVIAGIGNIYASEILFAAKICPEKCLNKLSNDELEKIIINSREILKKAIKLKGSTVNSFTFNKQHGDFQNYLNVYQRHGQKCLKCNQTIIKFKINNRSTFKCPECQKK